MKSEKIFLIDSNRTLVTGNFLMENRLNFGNDSLYSYVPMYERQVRDVAVK